ncbi:MAG: TonB-dependent receptor [Xanthomonadales bacterium]|nr:TonB-dependent receptor [Xanthomonadales bacterium]
MNRSKLAIAIAYGLAASVGATGVQAQNQEQEQTKRKKIEEVVVTATKREESLQDVPIAVSAMTTETLNQLGVSNFEDYVLQMPGVTAGGSGPGQNTVYIRGVASTTPNLTTAGVAGLAPNVAFYLDEQPLSQPGRNLDVYAADLARVEVLSGPQGTLFGASSQAGNVRLITNKPDLSGSYGYVKLGAGFVEDGDSDSKIEGMVNVPLSENFAIRAVAYADSKGGYIDNVPGTIDASESARFRPAGTIRENGVPVSDQRAGFQSTADLSDVTFLTADNNSLVEEDFNETDYQGIRLSARWDINEKWSALVSHQQQDLDADGVFFADPDLGDLEVQRFSPDRLEDTFDNTSWTVEGLIGDLELVYTGAYTDRDTDQTVDYTDYLFVGQYLPYYICDGSVTYPGSAAPSGTCQPPNLFVDSNSETEVQTHEIRVSTDPGKAFRLTAGGFYRDLELKERNDFTYPGSENAVLFGQIGFSPNFPQMTGYTSDPGPFPEGVIFRNDIKRTDEQFGLFGEGTYDFNEEFSLTVGARYYDIEVDFEGSANSSFCNGFQEDADAFGTDISDLYNADGEYEFIGTCDTSRHIVYTQGQSVADILATDPALSEAQANQIFNALNAPDKAATDGVIFKLTGQWRPNDAQLFYATVSEGFRPGLLNRPGGAQGPNNFTVPFELDTDEVTNYEVGIKSDFFDNTFRLNASLFFVDIEKLQTTIFDPSITNLFFSDNAADAEVLGIEGDFVWAPPVDGLTIAGAFSLLDTEITDVLTPTNDVRQGDELAFAPDFQGNIRARYEWPFMDTGLTAHVMPSISWSSEQFSDIIVINRAEIDSWTMASLTAGVSATNWSAELFIDNLTDERAEIARNFVFDRQQITYARPRTVGVRATFHF